MFFPLARLSIALLFEFQLQQVDLLPQDVDCVCSCFELIRRDLQFVPVLVLFENGALVSELVLTGRKLCLDLFIKQDALLRAVPLGVVACHSLNQLVLAGL